MKSVSLNMTRYRHSRYWALYNGSELLAVTVYRKGAESIINFINNLTTQYNTMSKKNTKSKKPATKNNDITATPAPEVQVILVECVASGERFRATLTHEDTSICHRTKGDWSLDAYFQRPLNVLVEEGIYKLANQRARNLFKEFYNREAEEAALWAQFEEERGEAEPETTEEPAVEAEPEATAEPQEQEETELEAALRKAEPPTNWIAACNIGNNAEKLAERAARGDIIAERNLHRLTEDAEAEKEESPAEQEKPAEPAKRTNTRKAVCQVILNGETEPQPIPADIELKPGVKLVRAYQGSTIEVLVEESGFTYNGKTYPTLTHISWLLTPYKASGNTFFGLPVKKRNTANL